jgi:hypothetical protein
VGTFKIFQIGDILRASHKYILAVVFTMAVLTPASAFHDGVPPCEEGQVGYWATIMVEGKKMALFLAKTNPPTGDSVFCGIDPDALIQVKATGKDM